MTKKLTCLLRMGLCHEDQEAHVSVEDGTWYDDQEAHMSVEDGTLSR